MMTDNSLTKKYDKWDKIVEEDDIKDTKPVAHSDVRSMQFNAGMNRFQILQVNYFDDAMEQRLGKRLRNLPQDNNEVWQLVVRKLRVWSSVSDNGEDENCRPLCLLLNCLYPKAAMIAQVVCDPPNILPTPSFILNKVTEAMLHPMSGSQRRPKTLTFAEPQLAGQLYQSFHQLGVEVSELSESQGVQEIVQKFSELLIKRDIAVASEVGENPGLLSTYGVDEQMAVQMYKTAARFAKLRPWKRITERSIIKFELSKSDTSVKKSSKYNSNGYDTVWATLLGHQSVDAFGLAIFFSKLDLLSRASLVDRKISIRKEDRGANKCSFTGLPAEPGTNLKKTKPPRIDTRDGSELKYRSAESLKSHWPSVRKYAITEDQFLSDIQAKRKYWHGTDITLLFEEGLYIPFDDLDFFDKHEDVGVIRAGVLPEFDKTMYPLLLQFHEGVPSRPTTQELIWLHRVMLCINNLVGDPSFSKFTPNDLMKVRSEEDKSLYFEISLENDDSACISGVSETIMVDFDSTIRFYEAEEEQEEETVVGTQSPEANIEKKPEKLHTDDDPNNTPNSSSTQPSEIIDDDKHNTLTDFSSNNREFEELNESSQQKQCVVM